MPEASVGSGADELVVFFESGADRLRRLRIEDRRPGAAIVIGFPYATVDGADVKDGRLACDAGECVRPPRNGPIMRQRISP
jgi:hypothetical protein